MHSRSASSSAKRPAVVAWGSTRVCDLHHHRHTSSVLLVSCGFQEPCLSEPTSAFCSKCAMSSSTSSFESDKHAPDTTNICTTYYAIIRQRPTHFKPYMRNWISPCHALSGAVTIGDA
eukprot:365253-Chlamydomonas_euryale.AAC.6